VNHGTEMDLNGFDGRIHLFHNAMERSRFQDEPAEWIPLASDVETRIQMSEPLTRQAMGLESASTISATFGDLYKVGGAEFLGALCEIMNTFTSSQGREMSGRFDPACILRECCRGSDSWAISAMLHRF
jgi:hypothetical protein